MNKIVAIILGAIVIIGGFLWLASANGSSAKSDDMTFATVEADVTKGAKLYDVRTPAEFAAGHFAGAINYPLQDLQEGKLPDVPTSTKLYVYCQSGNRSGLATKILRDAGYEVVDLRGLSNVQAIGGTLAK